MRDVEYHFNFKFEKSEFDTISITDIVLYYIRVVSEKQDEKILENG